LPPKAIELYSAEPLPAMPQRFCLVGADAAKPLAGYAKFTTCPLPDVAAPNVFARCKRTVRRDVTALDVPGATALPFRRIGWAGLNSTRRIDL
jgi:hypothetical protein